MTTDKKPKVLLLKDKSKIDKPLMVSGATLIIDSREQDLVIDAPIIVTGGDLKVIAKNIRGTKEAKIHTFKHKGQGGNFLIKSTESQSFENDYMKAEGKGLVAFANKKKHVVLQKAESDAVH